MKMNVYKTHYAFYTTREMHQVTATASKMRFVRSNASFSLMHVKLCAISSHCLAALPAATTDICIQQKVASYFRRLNSQNLNKTWRKWLLFQSVMDKNIICLHGNLYNHKGVKMFRRQYIFAKKYGCANEARFEPKTTISTMSLKSSATTCLSSS